MAEQRSYRDAEYRRRRRGCVGGEQKRQESDILDHLLHEDDGAPQVDAHDGGTLQTDETSLDNKTLNNDASTQLDETMKQSRNETVQQSCEEAEEVSVEVSVDDTVVDSVENTVKDAVDCPICYE
ncbi:hypothetical protein GN958_ATG05277 [Phytophthora infestans]|uniref:Uncharacterized protein n=1 Tax=Phytophthora infestans TaxID=4787 RepID=A0A8S9V1W5_PHYIN|nr:hypothetical protein GN958_ATG05277 [Phytophthora infestans]